MSMHGCWRLKSAALAPPSPTWYRTKLCWTRSEMMGSRQVSRFSWCEANSSAVCRLRSCKERPDRGGGCKEFAAAGRKKGGLDRREPRCGAQVHLRQPRIRSIPQTAQTLLLRLPYQPLLAAGSCLLGLRKSALEE